MQALSIGQAATLLGAGRQRKEDTIDPAVGIELCRIEGDYVESGDTVALLHINDVSNLASASALVNKAYAIGTIPPPPQDLIMT
ncbi:MAG: hypothetical protein ACYCW6_09330 [Candidatus Xenobia bacterium]